MDPTIRDVVAGLSAGGATTLVMHPLDLLKVRMQVDVGKPKRIVALVREVLSSSPPSSSHNVLQLYRGIGPNLLGNTVSWGLYFMLYNKLVARYAAGDNAGGHQYMGCAMAAGSVTSALTNPIWVLKTRMLSRSYQAHDPASYRSMVDGIKHIWRIDGLPGFWKGFVPGLFGVFQASIQFAVYDRLKVIRRRQTNRQQLGTAEFLTLSAASKCVAAVSMYPYQVVRSRLQTASSRYTSSVDVLRQVYRYEGLRGFYKGLVTNLARVVPATCITFVVYENVRQLLTVNN